jgi:hypothetical protein
VPIAVIGAMLIGVVLYLLLQLSFLGALRPSDLSHGWASLGSGDVLFGPFAGLATAIGLGWLATLLYTDAIISPGGTGLIYTASSSRVSYALARNGYVPGILGKIGLRDVPLWSIVFSFIVGMIVFGVLGMGMAPSMSMSAWILGSSGGGFGGLMGAMQGFGGGGSYAIAGGIGSGVLFAIAATLVSQVYLLGLNIVYLRVSEGLDASSTQQALQQKIDEARKRAADMGQKAREAAERARDQGRQPSVAAPVAAAPVAAPLAAPVAPAPVLSCPVCSAAVTPEDLFCQSCGHRLK